MSGFDRARDTARYYATVVQQRIVKSEYWCNYVVTVDARGVYQVFKETSWLPQSESLLPWREPTGRPVAYVTPDGLLVMLEGE